MDGGRSSVGGGSSGSVDDGMGVAVVEGNSNLLVNNLREKVFALDDKCERLEREKAALADLLATKRRDAELTRERYSDRIRNLEDESQMLKTEKMRLVDRLKLPEKERRSLLMHENELSELRRRLEEEEGHSADMVEENLCLKQEVKDLHLEMEELHDQFREDEAIEFRELQKELESTAKSCRILQFKLRKAERRIDLLETERVQADEKAARQQQQGEVRFQRPDERLLVLELEEELRAAKALNARLHDQIETVEEKRARYEQELDRVNDILTESENRRHVLQMELERLREQMSGAIQHDTSGKRTKGTTPQMSKVPGTQARQSSQEVDVTQVMRDLSDSLERENDLREQLKFAEEQAAATRKKASDLEEENEGLNTQLHQLSTKIGSTTSMEEHAESRTAVLAKQNVELTNRLKELETENIGLKASVTQLDERTSRLTKEVVRAKFSSGQSLSESPTEWGEMRTQVQSLEDECRGLRRKVVDLEASNAKTKTELEQQRKQGGAETRRKELELQTKDELKKKVIELETETVGLAAMVKNREDDNERLEEEISESREDMNRMLESFRRRETELRDDVEAVRHKNATLADLLELVNERAESTQRELDRHRKEVGGKAVTAGGDAVDGCDDTLGRLKTPDAKNNQNRIELLERLLAEETKKVLTVEKKLRLSDSAALETKDDTRLRQHEKEILLQELALCQKQLIGANDQIADLKGRLLAMKESHEDVKEDFAKVYKELEKVRKGVSQQPVTAKGKPEREPASWRWEKQEMERQLKEHKKKLEDVYSEMKRHQLKWKAAGEDVERENKIKEELEKKIGKLKEEYDCCSKESAELRNKVEELEELARKKDRQWEKEKNLLEAEKVAAENDAKQKDELIRSKDALILQKNDLIGEKDIVLRDRDEALQQKDMLVQQKDTELEFKDKDVRIKTEEIRQFRSELAEFRHHLSEKDERIRQLDEHVRRRDDRLKEKDEILQQINRKLVEKGNQVGDMDKTIRQVIRKLQARDCDLAMSGAELRRVQADLKTAQDRVVAERKSSLAELTEAEAWRTSVTRLEAELERAVEEKKRVSDEARDTVERMKLEDRRSKSDCDRVRLELNQALEKLHVQELTATMNQTDAFKTMMREKEGLIADKFKLTDEVNSLRRSVDMSSNQWKREKEDLQKLLVEKTKQLEELESKELQKTSSRPSTLSIAPKSADESFFEVEPSSSPSPSSSDVVCGLRAKLDRQEALWTAEKATLEEFYEVNSRTLQETVCQLRDACRALRHENDGQLQLLQSSRRAMSDLRNRYDMGVASWNEERERLLVSTGQVEHYRRQASDLEVSLENVRSQLLRAETKCREVENRLMVEENAWKTEKATLEAAARKFSEEDKAPATRVSEFRARFEKFGSSKSKKGEEEGRRTEREAQDACRELQKQLKELENQRERERANLVERLEKQREEYEREIHLIRDRNTMLQKKAKELSQLQRSVVDIQYRLVEDRNQWQLERSQLQRRLEEALQQYTTQKENISQLLAEIKKLRVLASGLVEQKGGEAKLRSRSLTPSAEKMRVTALTLYSARKATAEDKRASAATTTGGQTNVTREDNEKRGIDQPIINDLVQAIEETSRLADDLGKARNSKDQHLTASPGRSLGEGRGGGGGVGGEFKRSHSEVIPSFASGPTLPPASTATGSCWSSTTGNPPSFSIYATTRRPGRQGHLLSRSTSEDEDPGDRNRGPSAESQSPYTGFRQPPSNRGSMYASGTQSAYGSRDPSPDKAGQGQGHGLAAGIRGGGGGGLRKISPYPAAPPSMIITPLHTPRREQSIDRSDGDLMTSEDIRRLYAKLDAIGRQNASDVIVATGGGGGGGGEEVGATAVGVARQKAVTMIKSASMDAVENDDFSTASLGETGASRKKSDAAAAGHAITSRPQIIPGGTGTSVTSAAAATSGRVTSSRSGTKKPGPNKRSASVSPRTARRRFYEDYPYDPRNNASGTLITEDATRSNAPLHDPKREEASSSSSSSSFQVSGGVEDKAKTSTLRQFFQNVKDKRKLFGGRRSASVDSSQTHVSIARIGANVLSEPAAPSTYQPPAMTVHGQRRNDQKAVRSGSVESTLDDASSASSASRGRERTARR